MSFCFNFNWITFVELGNVSGPYLINLIVPKIAKQYLLIPVQIYYDSECKSNWFSFYQPNKLRSRQLLSERFEWRSFAEQRPFGLKALGRVERWKPAQDMTDNKNASSYTNRFNNIYYTFAINHRNCFWNKNHWKFISKCIRTLKSKLPPLISSTNNKLSPICNFLWLLLKHDFEW
jgi:hypothetical protein